jgi:hypothetical protein
MQYMFYKASAFNQSIGVWNVGSVKTSMSNMFYNATAFNQNLCAWKNKILSISRTDIFTGSGCTYQTTPAISSDPFCAVGTCP